MADPDQLLYLHGDLHLHIIEARCLPNMDLFAGHFSRCFTGCNACRTDHGDGYGSDDPGGGGGSHREMKIDHHRNIVTSDSYVTVSVPQATLARTRVLPNTHSPKWNEHFHILLAHPLEFLEFRIKDNDFFGADTMGKVLISAEEIASGKEISGWFTLVNSAGKQPNPEAALHIEMKFTPCDKNPVYRHGIAGDTLQGVRNTYFPLRRGGSVTLYQDAHVRDEDGLPKIELDNGLDRQHNRCWEDICHAISEAHHLVYIVGWSVFHKVRLIREPTKPLPRGGDMTLGELLKYKSQEGVRVLLLVWDDKTSHDKLLLKTAGMMKTHDEETKKFFKHSSVICVLSPRYASSKLGYFKQQVVGTVFTHHQKCVLVDTQAPGNNRKITAFLGGIDLCDGRYDTPEHRLFNGVETIFKDDFHQPTFPEGLKAPRQPWHDLHCRIDGPAAYDVLVNFAQRWQKATTWKEFSMLKKKMAPRWSDDSMIKIERISWILSPAFSISRSGSYKATSDDDPNLHVSREQDPESWNVQIFRSIDSGSARGFPKYYIEARAQNLDFSKKLVIDRSIQTAYVQAIRSAQNFIYMENQYFLGSSYAWPSYKDAGADHLIPMELAMKIASKIRANERFSVYVVIPMWPEGNPKDNAMQEILFWQAQTMQMMYQYIAKEIKSMQLSDSHPLDYLNFYCLGKREPITKAAAEVSGGADKISESQKFQRFMIYVHAKGMVVDDEYVIIGSANINQRSMAGSKDTEIAMGAYQPCHTWAKKGDHPRGQVYGYRMSLWAEHLGMLNECFKNPKSLECVKRVNEIGEDNWTKYTQEEFTLLQGHLLKYPIEVDVEGNVNPLPGCENFPDVGGRILGTQSQHMPDIVTT